MVEGPLPGATIISFFLERIRRKVRSFWGSISRTVLRAFRMKLCMRLAYCVVVGLSMVLLMGMPEGRTETEQEAGAPFCQAPAPSPCQQLQSTELVSNNQCCYLQCDRHSDEHLNTPVPHRALQGAPPSSLASGAGGPLSGGGTAYRPHCQGHTA